MRSAARPPKIDQLTALRFIAAAMIVVLHCSGKWGISTDLYRPFALGQGVSFFFVLSGFILAYVYPHLDSSADRVTFFRARAARICPLHVFTLALAVGLPIASMWGISMFVANLTLTQDWVPNRSFIFSFNAPAWTISAEAFFYLCFPGLIRNTQISKTLLFSILVVAAGVVFESTLDGPYRDIARDLVEFHPIMRISEFIFGIWIYQRFSERSEVRSSRSASAVEIAAVLLTAGSMLAIAPIAAILRTSGSLGDAAAAWFEQSGCAPLFGLLIFTLARGSGVVSRALNWRPLVLLGEVSFSMYLLHQLMIRFYEHHRNFFPDFSDVGSILIFWALLLVLSFATFFAIERPMQRILR